MSVRNFFLTKRRFIERFFSRNDEKGHSIDEIVVHPNSPLFGSSTSESYNYDNFQKIENFMDFFESPHMTSLLKDKSKVLILKFEASYKPTTENLAELNQKVEGNSMVILLAVDERKLFFLYWKSKHINHFLILKLYENEIYLNDSKLFEFLANFVGNSLKCGHLGIHTEVPIKNSENTSIDISKFADPRGYNLLLVAADEGDVHIVKIMLTLGLSSVFRDVNAQTFAWKKRHFEVLLILFKNNLTYPDSFNINECPNDIKEFIKISYELNAAILSKDESKILNILSQNTELNHFYNLNNESALAFALNHRLVDMYSILISKNILFGPHEKFSKIKNKMKESDRKKLREIHFKESKILPYNHMHVLLSNSRLGHDTFDVKTKYKIMQDAFLSLNANPFIQIILMIVAASRNFCIIFDFNRDTVEVIDPTMDEFTDGLFYLSGRIYIGAKKLLDENLRFEALGVMAHEFCHYALSLIYKNSANPYFCNDLNTKEEFENILIFCMKNAGTEPLIDIVHSGYHESVHHAELIVRVPHLIMKYQKSPQKMNEIKSTFHQLFEIYENQIFKEMKEALPKIEAKAECEQEKTKKKIKKIKFISAVVVLLSLLGVGLGIFITRRIFYKPFYKYSALPRNYQIRVQNGRVIYKHVDIKFSDLFDENSTAYDLLTSDDISQMLKNNPLDFNNPHLFYLNELIAFGWKNLTTKLKNKFLTSNVTFQNESIKFETLNKFSPDAFNFLNSHDIIQVLDGVTISVHKMIKNESAFYIERRVFTEYIYQIYYKFMTKLNGDKNQLDCVYKNTTGIGNDTFKAFYEHYKNLHFSHINSETNNIKQMDYYLRCFVSGFKIINPLTGDTEDSLLMHKSFQMGFEDILIESGVKFKINSSRIFIFSANAGTGKTDTFRQIALRIKQLYPDRWVSYINYGRNRNFDMKIDTVDDVMKALLTILEVDRSYLFEVKIFEQYFMSGRMILLWDGYDQIVPNWMYPTRATKILEIIHFNTSNILFVSTRPSSSDKLRRTFKIEPYTFVPLNKASIIEFLHGFFVSQNIQEANIPIYIEKVQRIVNSTMSTNDFNTPLPLGMIAYGLSNDKEIYKTENLYQVYQKFIETKLHMWLNNINGERKLIESIMMSKISLPEIYQNYALRSFPDNSIKSFIRYLSLRLKIMTRKFPKKIKINQISEMGILHINNERSFTFAHSTFIEFFTAQYIIQNLFRSEDDLHQHEAELRIQLFFWAIQNSGISIFIESYFYTIQMNQTREFDPHVVELLRTKYTNFMVNMLSTQTVPISVLMQFFSKNHLLLTHLLQIDSSNGVYPATFNFAYFNTFSYKSINRTEILNVGKRILKKDEFQKFTSIENHKGIILYSMYCIKQSQNSSIYARKFIPEYDLSDEIFQSNNASEVLLTIARNLTSSELIKLLTSDIIWYMPNRNNEISANLRDNDLEFFVTLFHLIEANLSRDEQKKWIFKVMKFPFLLQDKANRDFLAKKIEDLLSDLEIFDAYSELNILHYSVTIHNSVPSFERFNNSWNFLISHTNESQQKQILKQLGNVECYMNQKYTNLCYLVPKINLLQASLIVGFNSVHNNSLSFQNMLKLYKSYFNNTELQELILKGSKEFILFLVNVRYINDCRAYAGFLKDLFKNNARVLSNFLHEPVESTVFNIFDLLRNYQYFPENLEIFKTVNKKSSKNNKDKHD